MRRIGPIPGAALILLLVWASAGAAPGGAETLSAEKSLVWGPGLHADIVLPVRYFYIQAVTAGGRNFTQSPGTCNFCQSQQREGVALISSDVTQAQSIHSHRLPLRGLLTYHRSNKFCSGASLILPT
ncbi:hypothetical protein XELAEV_18003304mg [Xenopus laevis]|nr:hypothetical protein XELAEV_18003304mg [Xenopus laevis]